MTFLEATNMFKTARYLLFGPCATKQHEAATVAADSAISEARALTSDLARLSESVDPLADLVKNVKQSNGHQYKRHTNNVSIAPIY